MSFANLHQLFEQDCPHGVGFAIHADEMRELLSGLVISMSQNPQRYRDIPMGQANDVRFSFSIDPATTVSDDYLLTTRITILIHQPGAHAAPIISSEYGLEDLPIEAEFDPLEKSFRWKPVVDTQPRLISDVLDDGALIAAGYVRQDGGPDRQRFNEEFYYGFKWLIVRNLMPSIIRNIPFPQVQTWLVACEAQPPFVTSRDLGYLRVWTNDVVDHLPHCGTENRSTESAATSWQLSSTSNPASEHENDSPRLAFHIGARNLLRWEADGLAPAVMLSRSGGGFIRWSYRAAAGLTRLNLNLEQTPTGGRLLLDADLKALGIGTSWIDGPSGSRLSLFSGSLTFDCRIDAALSAEYDGRRGRLELRLDARATVHNVNVDAHGVWPLTEIASEIVDYLFANGHIKLEQEYHARRSIEVLNLTDVGPLSRNAQTFQRVGTSSLLLGVEPNAG